MFVFFLLGLFTCSLRSPGFGLTLVSESTTGLTRAAEASTYSLSHTSTPSQGHGRATGGREGGEAGGEMQENQHVLPEDVGTRTASLLMEEIVKASNCKNSK